MTAGQRLGIGLVAASLCVAGALAWLGRAVDEDADAGAEIAQGTGDASSSGRSGAAGGDDQADLEAMGGETVSDADAAARAERLERIERLREAVQRQRAALNEDRAVRQELAATLGRLRTELERSRAEVESLEQELSAAAPQGGTDSDR